LLNVKLLVHHVIFRQGGVVRSGHNEFLVKKIYSSGGYCVTVPIKYRRGFHVRVTSTSDKILLTCQTVFKEEEM
jgi:hypothetical protein